MPDNTEPQGSGHKPGHDRALDVRAMNCPLPILKTKAEFAHMQAGQVLKVTYRQVEYVRELEMFSKQTGNRVIHTEREGTTHATWIEKV